VKNLEIECPVCGSMMTIDLEYDRKDDDNLMEGIASYTHKGSNKCKNGHCVFGMFVVSEYEEEESEEDE
jgi:hypothetical protein